MGTRRTYITAAIPYVNGRPHLGHALEFVQADALARTARLRGDEVRSQWGTDDNAPKNVHAARAAGVPVRRPPTRGGGLGGGRRRARRSRFLE
jgi:methionyl-tRNA synthetase